MHLSLGLSLKGRNGLLNRVRIVVADDGVTPAMAEVESGDTIADAFPATSLDTANYEVVGDETDSIIDVIPEWSLNGEEWQAEANATREDDETVTVRHLPAAWLPMLTRQANGTITPLVRLLRRLIMAARRRWAALLIRAAPS